MPSRNQVSRSIRQKINNHYRTFSKDKANGDSCIKPCIVECNQQACTTNPHSMKMTSHHVQFDDLSFKLDFGSAVTVVVKKEIKTFSPGFINVYDSFLFFLLLFRTRIIIKVKFKKKEPFFRSKKTFFSRLTTFRLNTKPKGEVLCYWSFRRSCLDVLSSHDSLVSVFVSMMKTSCTFQYSSVFGPWNLTPKCLQFHLFL